jgi:Na+-translocating ferredoxin:NAD+ oxidoreductase RnfC subunit
LSSKTIAVKHDEGLRLPEDISVFSVRDYYPAGAERTLVKDVLKKTLPEDSIPAKQGIIVLNVQTMAAIYEAVCLDRKADTRLITVAKMSDMSGTVARVRLGANMHDVAEKIYPGAVCVHSGGGMMNARMVADDAVIEETVNFLGVGMLPLYRESPLCSKCGYCNSVCPAGLNVREIARLVDDGKIKSTARLHPQSCMECGSCSHICLAGRNLAARVMTAKSSLKAADACNTESAMEQAQTI